MTETRKVAAILCLEVTVTLCQFPYLSLASALFFAASDRGQGDPRRRRSERAANRFHAAQRGHRLDRGGRR